MLAKIINTYNKEYLYNELEIVTLNILNTKLVINTHSIYDIEQVYIKENGKTEITKINETDSIRTLADIILEIITNPNLKCFILSNTEVNSKDKFYLEINLS